MKHSRAWTACEPSGMTTCLGYISDQFPREHPRRPQLCDFSFENAYALTMSALVAGYDSSDDEQPHASSSTLPKLGNGMLPAAAHDDEEDDDELEEQAKKDAFGLSAQPTTRSNGVERKAEVAAAPDVLREVCDAKQKKMPSADGLRIQMERALRSSLDPQTRSSTSTSPTRTCLDLSQDRRIRSTSSGTRA